MYYILNIVSFNRFTTEYSVSGRRSELINVKASISRLSMKSIWPPWRHSASGLHPFAAMMVGLLFSVLSVLFFSHLLSLARLLRGQGAAAAGYEPRVVGHPVAGCVRRSTNGCVHFCVSAAGRAGWRTRLPLRGGPGSECSRPSVPLPVPSVRHVHCPAAVLAITLERLGGIARLGANILC